MQYVSVRAGCCQCLVLCRASWQEGGRVMDTCWAKWGSFARSGLRTWELTLRGCTVRPSASPSTGWGWEYTKMRDTQKWGIHKNSRRQWAQPPYLSWVDLSEHLREGQEEATPTSWHPQWWEALLPGLQARTLSGWQSALGESDRSWDQLGHSPALSLLTSVQTESSPPQCPWPNLKWLGEPSNKWID